MVRYAALQASRRPAADYWDHATLIELAVLANDRDAASEALDSALASRPVGWHLESTARNLRLIRERRSAAGQDAGWIAALEDELAQAAGSPAGPAGAAQEPPR